MTGAVVYWSNEELEARFRAAGDVVERTHFQAILLLAKGRTGPKVALWIAARLGFEHVHPPRGW